jgi:hypothetical protein
LLSFSPQLCSWSEPGGKKFKFQKSNCFPEPFLFGDSSFWNWEALVSNRATNPN